MRSDVRTCTPDDALSEPARIMWERDCGCVPVVASEGSGRVVGMITDRDLCMATFTGDARLAEMQVKSAMSERVYSCHPDDPLSEAEAIMRAAQVRRLPVVDEVGHLRGLLSLADVAEAAAGLRIPAGTVSAAEVGLVLEAICRPRSQLVPRPR
jgi:CBS domain-containing protein